MTFLDGLGSLPQLGAYSVDALRYLKAEAVSKLQEIAPLADNDPSLTHAPIYDPARFVQLGSFAIEKGPLEFVLHAFNLQAPTTRDNAMRVVRACQVLKPILLEGSPGVGKTSLITALANISGHNLCRINLSDQTDLIDLFGSDLPVEGGGPGEFAWKDAEFLKALQEGHWVLLDEMNLAPQSVLEGLNAILDHRGTVYIPELGRSFTRHPAFRIFAAQNPLHQGGGRKGLPKSFVNRFTKVYINELSSDDLALVCRHLFPDCNVDILRAMIAYNASLLEEIGMRRAFARDGSPWEFNLRDVIRWGTLSTLGPQHPAEHLGTIYLQRFRSIDDRKHARLLFDSVFSLSTHHLDRAPHPKISSTFLQFGHFQIQRKNLTLRTRPGRILQSQLSALESIGHCISQSWLAILTGPHDSGKTDVVRVLANYTGNFLHEISINSATDPMDILGSFEQVDNHGHALLIIQRVCSLVETHFRSTLGSKLPEAENLTVLHKTLRVSLARKSFTSALQTASTILDELGILDDHLAAECLGLQARIQNLVTLGDIACRFEWVDGPLVRAMKQGHWVLMEGANLCNPSVLDRLNSLCEPDGVLTLSERGYVDGKVQLVKPHDNFRLLMSVDPLYGELSRAMRNRGIEISLVTEVNVEDQKRLRNHLRLPLVMAQEDLSTLSVGFDATRRGVIGRNELPSSLPILQWPSGRALDQDSALSALVDQASLLSISQSSVPEVADALLYVLARSSAPAYMTHSYRFLLVLEKTMRASFGHLQHFLRTFPSTQGYTALAPLRENYSKLREVPLDFIFAQVSADVFFPSWRVRY